MSGISKSYVNISTSANGQIDSLSSYNLIEVNDLVSPGSNNLLGTVAEPLNPLLGPLAVNGGPTPTHALLSCSPAFNAAMADSTTDQRGFSRNQFGGTDIGAFESEVNIGIGIKKVVTSLANSGPGTLRELVTSACSTDTILFDPMLNGDTILLSGSKIIIDRDLTIIGNGADSTIIDGEKKVAIFEVSAGTQVVLTNLTLQRAKAKNFDAGAIDNHGVLKIEDSKVTTNVSANIHSTGGIINRSGAICEVNNSYITYNIGDYAGGITNELGGTLVLQNSEISKNTGDRGGGIRSSGSLQIQSCILDSNEAHGSLGDGGAINSDDGFLSVDSCTFRGNQAVETFSKGGAVYMSDSSIVLNSIFLNNQAGRWGGAIYQTAGNATIRASRFEGNTVSNNSGDGGALYLRGNSAILNSIFLNNEAQSEGGGIYHTSGKMFVDASSFEGNKAGTSLGGGGAIYLGNNGTVLNSTLRFNESSDEGGGIYHSSGKLVVRASVFEANRALNNTSGGALYVKDSCIMSNSTLVNNVATASGGGIYHSSGYLLLSQTTISGNAANGTGFYKGGGGIYCSSGNGFIENSTVTQNSANEGGGVYLKNGNLTFNSTIIAGNSASGLGKDGYKDGGTVSPSSSHNLVGKRNNFGMPAGNFNQRGTNGLPLHPGLDTLADNGGPTLTHALLPGSPAFDAGISDSLTDQRGQPRPTFCRPDIGAFESQTYLDTSSVIESKSLTCDFMIAPISGVIWDTSGYYVDSVINRFGCDSLRYDINLQINSPAYTVIDTFAYNSYTSPSGKYTWTESGSHIDTTIDSNGCGRVYHINLSINCDWKAPGFASNNRVTTQDAGTTRIVFDHTNTPYIVFRDKVLNKARVRSFDGISWQDVGTPGFSAGDVSSTDMAIDKNGVIYVAFRDFTQGNKVTVMKYADTSWVLVGGAGLSIGNSEYVSLVLDSAGVPVVGYRDNANGFKATVQKFNSSTNTWGVLGSAGFSPAGVTHIAMAADQAGVPYIVFRDGNTTDRRATVMKYNGSSWDIVDTAGFTAGRAQFNDIAFDGGGIPYVVYQDQAKGNKASVKKLEGGHWQTVGMEGFSDRSVQHTRIAIDPAGTPYVVYRDAASQQATVMTFTNSQWSILGSPDFSPGGSSFTSIAIDSEGNPMVALTQGGVRAYSYSCVSGYQQLTGCDSILSLNGTEFWTETGIYHDTLQNGLGHDSIVAVALELTKSSDTTFSASACYSYISPSGLYIWDSSGVFTDTLTNIAGCDSLITVSLIIKVSDTTLSITGCDSVVSPSGLYTWTSTGTYMDTLQNSNGCDSLITANVTVHPSTTSTISPIACYSYSSPSGLYIWNTSGTYLDTVTNGNGCDSVITVNLTLNVNDTTLNLTGCDSVVSPSGLYTWINSGTYRDTLQNINGCDSLITANVTVHPGTASTISPTACYSYSSPSGLYIWNTSGTYLDTVTNGNGCDSVITVNLTLNMNDTTLNFTGCDSVVSPSGLYTWTSPGTYMDTLQNVKGCDSLITANVTINPCPVDCQMGTWSAWSACDTSCGGGTRFRTRDILVQAAYGGLACGDTIEYDTCNTQPCCTTTNIFFTDSICPGDSLFVAKAWQTTIGTYVDSAVSVLGCDSLLHTSLYFKDSSSCIVDSTVETILYLVSDSAWTLSTVVTVETSNNYPWPGAAAYLPHDSTFTLPVEVGQPYS